jgi:hypothetical protein
MSFHPGAYCGGVRTLEDLRIRCVIDAETGCWLWRGAYSQDRSRHGQPTTRVWLPVVPPGGARTSTAPRAAWLMAGKPLPPKGVVWRHLCRNPECINPQHGKGGTRQEMYAAFVADGRMRGDPRRAAVNAINRQSQLVPPEKVRKAEEMFAAGALQKDVRAALGLSPTSAARIRKGLHPNSSSKQHVVANASVFAWRGGSREAA